MVTSLLNIIYIFFLVISSTLFVYYTKLYSEKNKINDLLLCIFCMFLSLFCAIKLFQNKNIYLFLMTIFIKVIPILLLTIIDTFIFKTKMTFYKSLGIFTIIVGIIIIEL